MAFNMPGFLLLLGLLNDDVDDDIDLSCYSETSGESDYELSDDQPQHFCITKTG